MIEGLAQCATRALATLRHDLLRLESLEGLHRGSHHVDRVVAAQRLGQDVADAGYLNDGTDATTSDDTGSRRSRLQEHAGRAEGRLHLVRDGSPIQRHRDHRLLGGVPTLADAVRNFASLAEANADLALAIADNDDAAEGEGSAALVHL